VGHNTVNAPQFSPPALFLEIVKYFLHGQDIVMEPFEFATRHLTHIFGKGLLSFPLMNGLGRLAVHHAFVIKLNPINLASRPTLSRCA
jgi:hypothetical protein